MYAELEFIVSFVLTNLLAIWPYLLITIPIAVAVQMSGASKYIKRAFAATPVIAIILATLVGAFSPFCSCTVIPIIASLLISGVPLAPVMAFWIASPSMDPEIFFLSVATIGWDLAIWLVLATLILSLSAGFITHWLMARNLFGTEILRTSSIPANRSQWQIIQDGWHTARGWFKQRFTPQTAHAATPHTVALTLQPAETSCCSDPTSQPVQLDVASAETSCCSTPAATSSRCGEGESCAVPSISFKQRLFDETWTASVMVIKFMMLAFFLEALIVRYVPQAWIISVVGTDNPFATVTAALIGIPVYTSSLAALPLVSGLMEQGMTSGAALAFLIAGPTTTLPAMAAVWGIVNRRVFGAYVAFSLVGAVLFGLLMQAAG